MTDAESRSSPADPAATADFCATQVRSYDHDRYLTALFAPDSRRPALFALYAFNIEIAKIRETVSEPTLGRIRLQWWRETLDGLFDARPRHHAVAVALAEAISRFGLTRRHFERLIEGRARDLEDAPPEDLAALESYADATSGALTRLALEVLGAGGEDAMRAGHHGGVAWALCGLLRAVPFHARQRRVYLPADLLAAAGIRPGAVCEGAAGAAVCGVVREVAGLAERHLQAARRLREAIPTSALAAMLPLALVGSDLRRLARRGYDVFAIPSRHNSLMRQARIAIAALTGRY